MGSNPLPPLIPLHPGLTFLPFEIDYLFYAGPPAAPPNDPQVPAHEVEPDQADVAIDMPV
uniref:Uncharacterized protein n=1 Tax=Physcomitrium patens TaxID=3218 RepID=A0A2K1KAD6_PHYPA|nr:hypothetical protein PHYPA_009922 [Physcomitrium patens]